jgi:hypothetical protein
MHAKTIKRENKKDKKQKNKTKLDKHKHKNKNIVQQTFLAIKKNK